VLNTNELNVVNLLITRKGFRIAVSGYYIVVDIDRKSVGNNYIKSQ